MEEDKKNKQKFGIELERTKKVTFPRYIPNLSRHLPMKIVEHTPFKSVFSFLTNCRQIST